MKKCPFCAEEIQDEAIKCRYCGEYLQTATSAVAVSPGSVKEGQGSGERPAIKDILSRISVSSSGAQGGLSEAEISRLMNPWDKDDQGAFYVSMKAGQAIGESLGLASASSMEKMYNMGYENTVAAILLSVKRSGGELLSAADVPSGAIIEARLSSDLFSLGAVLRFNVLYSDESSILVKAASEVKGQMFDWGKGKRALNAVLDAASSYS